MNQNPLKDAFLQFSRNGRWGCCVACPRDSAHHAYPEFCPETHRYDHQFNIDALATSYKSHTRNESPSP